MNIQRSFGMRTFLWSFWSGSTGKRKKEQWSSIQAMAESRGKRRVFPWSSLGGSSETALTAGDVPIYIHKQVNAAQEPRGTRWDRATRMPSRENGVHDYHTTHPHTPIQLGQIVFLDIVEAFLQGSSMCLMILLYQSP